MDVVDFKKRDKALYNAGTEPTLVHVPAMPFIMVDGRGDPNNNPGFQAGMDALYSLSYDIRMSPKKNAAPAGYYPYVVPPPEGLWWIEGSVFNFSHRENWRWILMIRQPDFVTDAVFAEAMERVAQKKKLDLALCTPRLDTYYEGDAVQILHLGPFETEPESVAKMTQFCLQSGWEDQVGHGSKHHEIYFSDPRKVAPEKYRTIIRHPVARKG